MICRAAREKMEKENRQLEEQLAKLKAMMANEKVKRGTTPPTSESRWRSSQPNLQRPPQLGGGSRSGSRSGSRPTSAAARKGGAVTTHAAEDGGEEGMMAFGGRAVAVGDQIKAETEQKRREDARRKKDVEGLVIGSAAPVAPRKTGKVAGSVPPRSGRPTVKIPAASVRPIKRPTGPGSEAAKAQDHAHAPTAAATTATATATTTARMTATSTSVEREGDRIMEARPGIATGTDDPLDAAVDGAAGVYDAVGAQQDFQAAVNEWRNASEGMPKAEEQGGAFWSMGGDASPPGTPPGGMAVGTDDGPAAGSGGGALLEGAYDPAAAQRSFQDALAEWRGVSSDAGRPSAAAAAAQDRERAAAAAPSQRPQTVASHDMQTDAQPLMRVQRPGSASQTSYLKRLMMADIQAERKREFERKRIEQERAKMRAETEAKIKALREETDRKIREDDIKAGLLPAEDDDAYSYYSSDGEAGA